MNQSADHALTTAIGQLAAAVADLADAVRSSHATQQPAPAAPGRLEFGQKLGDDILARLRDREMLLLDDPAQQLDRDHIGWHDGTRVWLSPTETANKLMRTTRGAGQLLLAAGLIHSSTEGGVQRATVGAHLAGGRRRVWHLTPDFAAQVITAARGLVGAESGPVLPSRM